jgi:hypothetical protein
MVLGVMEGRFHNCELGDAINYSTPEKLCLTETLAKPTPGLQRLLPGNSDEIILVEMKIE